MAMESRAFVTLLQTLLWLLPSYITHAVEDDILCLKTLQESLIDPYGILKYSWNFADTTNGFLCKFGGVDCWHPDENRVLNLRLSNMGLQGQFPRGLEYCSSLTGLDLSRNNLSGPIPADIQKKIPYVIQLDLSFNNFSGEIPANLSNCSYLNVLDLEHNRLTGRIPWQLKQLARLTTINVADNLLSGLIPQLSHQPLPSSFANNPGLCGPPLAKCIPPPKKSHTGFIVGLAIAGALVGNSVGGVVLYFCLRKLPMKKKEKGVKGAKVFSELQLDGETR